LIDRFRGRHRSDSRRGQALAEFALALPILILIVLVGLDFGRAFTGWVGLQQSARIAANFVSINPTAWDGSSGGGAAKAKTRAKLKDLLYSDASTSNCIKNGANWLTIVVNSPTNTSYQTGDPATVTVSCDFDLITPIIGAILPDPLKMTASASFPIRTTVVSNIVGLCNAQFYWTYPGTGSTYHFVDISSPTAASWSWDFGDGQSSTTHYPDHTYAGAGTYTVRLDVTGSAGSCFRTYPLTVGSSGFPVANFSASPTSGDPPLTVQFTDLSSGNPTSWSWDFENDGIVDATTQFPSHTYTVSGNYTAKLTVNGGSYQTVSISVASLAPVPVANFTFSPTSGTAPLFVQFTDTSTNNPTSWAWDFNGDSVIDSTSPNPTYTYNTAGTYTITLTASNASGPSVPPKTSTITVSTSLCQVPNFVGDNYKHGGQAAFQTNENAKWSGAGFTTTVIFNPLPTSAGGSVTSQTLTAGSFQSCSGATIQINGSW
jgi:PKD repeat protein